MEGVLTPLSALPLGEFIVQVVVVVWVKDRLGPGVYMSLGIITLQYLHGIIIKMVKKIVNCMVS